MSAEKLSQFTFAIGDHVGSDVNNSVAEEFGNTQVPRSEVKRAVWRVGGCLLRMEVWGPTKPSSQ